MQMEGERHMSRETTNKDLYKSYDYHCTFNAWMALNDVNLLGATEDGILYEYAYVKGGTKRWAKTIGEDWQSIAQDVERVRNEIDEA